jgi:hypothetical protein
MKVDILHAWGYEKCIAVTILGKDQKEIINLWGLDVGYRER